MEALERWQDLPVQSLHCETPRDIATRLIKQYTDRYVPIYESMIGGQKRIKATACNILFTDIVEQMQLNGPFHWVDKKGNPMRYRSGIVGLATELSANGLIAWFEQYGRDYKWYHVTREQALLNASKNVLTAVTYFNPKPGKSGHIATVLEDGTIAQAGAGMPFVGKSIETGFGNLPIQFYAYAAENT
jgi:hypothetical protein